MLTSYFVFRLFRNGTIKSIKAIVDNLNQAKLDSNVGTLHSLIC